MFAPTYGTLMAARFVAGLPHGAFFGIAALVAAHLMGPQNRAKAVAHVMTGLTVATVLGVPVASWLGQHLGWRSAFGLVVVVGLVTLIAIWFWLPDLHSMHVTSPLTELGALKRVQVWLALLVGMVGFGGMFAVYTYVSTTLTDVAGPVARDWFRWRSWSSASAWSSATWSAAGWPTSRWSAVCTSRSSPWASRWPLFVTAAHNPWTAMAGLFLIGAAGSAIGPALQTRLMDVAHDAQTLAAALNHSALNIANAAGAWIGGVVIAAGYGYTAPAARRAGRSSHVAGLVVLTVAVVLQRWSRA